MLFGKEIDLFSLLTVLFWVVVFLEKMFIMHRDLVSRLNNLVGYNLPDSYLGIPLSIFIINITNST